MANLLSPSVCMKKTIGSTSTKLLLTSYRNISQRNMMYFFLDSDFHTLMPKEVRSAFRCIAKTSRGWRCQKQN